MTPTLPDNWTPMFRPIAEPQDRNDDHIRDDTKMDHIHYAANLVHIVDVNELTDTPAKLVRVAKFYFKEKQ